MSRELLKRALASMRRTRSIPTGESIDTMSAIEDELVKPDPEPVAWALFSKELMPTGAAYAIRRVEIQLAQIESDLDIQDAKIRPLYAEPVDQSARIADLTERLAKATLDYAKSSNLLTERITELEKQLADQSAQIAALKHELQQADEDYVSVEEAYLQCQKDLYDETEKLAALQAKREPLTSDQVREVYRTAFPKGPYVYTNDAFVFARMIEKAHGITHD